MTFPEGLWLFVRSVIYESAVRAHQRDSTNQDIVAFVHWMWAEWDMPTYV